MATKPSEWIRTGVESIAFGPEGPGGYVTKVTRLHANVPITLPHSASNQVMSRLLMRSMNQRKGLAKLHLIRGIVINNQPYLLSVQENIHGERLPSTKDFAHKFGEGIPSVFEDIEGRNVVSTPEGFRLVDALVRKELRPKQMRQKCVEAEKCYCDWNEFVKKFPQVGELPKDYELPEKLKQTYSPKEHKWVMQLENEVKGRKAR